MWMKMHLRSLFWSMSALTGTYIPCRYQCRVRGVVILEVRLCFECKNISLKNTATWDSNFIIPLTGRLVVLKLGTSTVQRCSKSFLFTLGQNHFIGSILTQTLKVGVTGHGCNHVDALARPVRRNHPDHNQMQSQNAIIHNSHFLSWMGAKQTDPRCSDNVVVQLY